MASSRRSRQEKANANSNANVNANTNGVPRLFCIRTTLVLLILAISSLSIYFSYTLTKLYAQVNVDTSTISTLQSQLNDQKAIIDRFNNSITNADVESHVQELEQSLKDTQENMVHSLDSTTKQIQTLLNSTVDKLDKTVK